MKESYLAILKRVKEEGMLDGHIVEKSHREVVEQLVKEGKIRQVKELEYELTHDGKIALDIYKKHHPKKYERLKLEGF